ncbi:MULTISPECIES: hypothetical protein [unclassified Bradyrhizobium]
MNSTQSSRRRAGYSEGKLIAAGSYIPAQSLITVARADPAYPLTQVLDTTVHESFHALEDKLLTDQEMQVLKREDARLREVVRRTFGFTSSRSASSLASRCASTSATRGNAGAGL